jgi:hypothetical protein
MPSLSRLPSLALAGVVAAVALPAYAQNVQTRTLTKPDVEYSEPFTQITGLRELRDGRVVVSDIRDKVVEAVDFKAGSAVKIGREGSGPGEYALPRSVFPLPGDSSVVVDALNRRLLVVLPDAKPGGFIELGSGGGGGGMIIGGSSVAAIDARGRFYSQGPPIQMVNGAPQTSDSTPIERWDRATNKRDTLAWLQMPKGSAQVSGGRGNMNVRIGAANPFSPQDQWAVAPDGRVAVVHADDYHVDWADAAGRRTSAPPIRFDRLKVTEAHKQEWRESMKSATGIMVTNNNGKQTAQAVPMRNVQDPPDWPEYMPPFLTNAVSFANDGTLWVKRTTVAGAPPTYDLIDGAGRVTQHVVFPKRTKLVGFGNGTVYLVRLDEDDLEYLQRYRFTPAEHP